MRSARLSLSALGLLATVALGACAQGEVDDSTGLFTAPSDAGSGAPDTSGSHNDYGDDGSSGPSNPGSPGAPGDDSGAGGGTDSSTGDDSSAPDTGSSSGGNVDSGSGGNVGTMCPNTTKYQLEWTALVVAGSGTACTTGADCQTTECCFVAPAGAGALCLPL